MKYIEELDAGSIFDLNNNRYVLGADFKSNGNRMCINIKNGFVQWLASNEVVNQIELYYRDEEGNILPVKEFNYVDPLKSADFS
jgi:hypothetical protein